MAGLFPEAPATTSAVQIIRNKTPARFRDWFRSSVDKWQSWRDEAKEDYGFVAGDQWRNEDRDKMAKEGRPAITINKIKPQINILSGYQRSNRLDFDFLPRTSDDAKLCEVRKGMTKYVMDETDYEYAESQVFLDGAICGIGWFEVKYQFDYESFDGEVKIKRISPFSVYPDPEAREQDYSDAKFILRARWMDKEELISLYPEYKMEIEAQYDVYDKDEPLDGYVGVEPLWYQRESHKLRLVECWYKETKRQTVYVLPDGTVLDGLRREELETLQLMGQAPRKMRVPRSKVRVCIFFSEVVLEEIDSPYEHGEFPFVPFVVYNFGEGDLAAGVVRDIKDPQREVNKRRSQMLHVLNTSSNSGWIMEEGAMTPQDERNLHQSGARPGVVIKTLSGRMGSLQRMQPPAPPSGLFEAGQQSEQDIPNISGINESLMGVQMPAQASGRAIELKQRQGITHIVPLFDNLRLAKKKIAYLLWGKRNRKGLIPQYYTEAKVYRIIGKNGKQQFVPVNQPVVDPLTGAIQETLNDLSQGEFDVIISDTTANATQRISQFWSLTDAVGKLGIPGEMVFDILLDLSDIPNKEDVIQRWQQRQQQQQQAAAAQQQLAQQQQLWEQQKEALSRISFKDAPLPIQLQLAAKAGLVPQQLADQVLRQAIGAYQRPVDAAQPMPAAQTPQGGLPPEAMQALAQLSAMQAQGGQPQPQGGAVTQSAMQSLMAGQSPAV